MPSVTREVLREEHKVEYDVDQNMQVDDYDRLAFQNLLASGRVVPIISDQVIIDRLLGGYERFLARYATYVKMPEHFACRDSLVGLVKYHKHNPEKPLKSQALKFEYLNHITIPSPKMT